MQDQLSWAQAACARILRPLVRLALAMGLKYPQLDELLRTLLLEEARGLWRGKGAGPNLSQLAITTGLNRKAVTARLRERHDPLPHTEASAAAKTFTLWLQLAAQDPAYRRLPVRDTAQGLSFEILARQASRGNVHHRTILEELLRLQMVAEHASDVELAAAAFVPAQDLQTMLAFVGDNTRDHLQAAVNNTLGQTPRMLERAVYAGGLSLEDCERLHQWTRERWDQLHHELVDSMTQAVGQAGESPKGRIRVGIYTYYEPTPDEPNLRPQKDAARPSEEAP